MRFHNTAVDCRWWTPWNSSYYYRYSHFKSQLKNGIIRWSPIVGIKVWVFTDIYSQVDTDSEQTNKNTWMSWHVLVYMIMKFMAFRRTKVLTKICAENYKCVQISFFTRDRWIQWWSLDHNSIHPKDILMSESHCWNSWNSNSLSEYYIWQSIDLQNLITSTVLVL